MSFTTPCAADLQPHPSEHLSDQCAQRCELRLKLLTWLDSIALCAAADTDECVYDDGVANVEEAAA